MLAQKVYQLTLAGGGDEDRGGDLGTEGVEDLTTEGVDDPAAAPRSWELGERLPVLSYSLPPMGNFLAPGECGGGVGLLRGEATDLEVDAPLSLEPYGVQVRYCAAEHETRGSLSLRALVEDGRVVEVDFEGDPDWAACVRERTVLWRFDEDGPLTARFTVTFQPAETWPLGLHEFP